MFSYFYVDTKPSWSSRWFCQSFSTDVLPFKWIRSFSTFARSILSFLNGIHSICPKLPLFSHPPALFPRGLKFLNQVSFYWWDVSPFFFVNVLIRWFSGKILMELQVHHSSFSFFSGGLKSSFVDHIISSFQMISHSGAPINYSPQASHLFWGVEDISEDSHCHS